MRETYLIVRYMKMNGAWEQAEYTAVSLLYPADAAHINRKFEQTGIKAESLCQQILRGKADSKLTLCSISATRKKQAIWAFRANIKKVAVL